MKSKYLLTLLPVVALGFALPARADEASAKTDANLADVRGDAARVAMKELDREIDELDAMADNAPTKADKDAAKAEIDALKARRSDLRKTYVQAHYDELTADIRVQADKFGAWTKRTFTSDPADKAADEMQDAKKDAQKAGANAYAYASSTGAALDLEAYKLRPTDTNKDEAKAALKALDQKIDELDDQADKMPRGADRDAAKRRVKALEDRKDDLKHEFNKARFDALVDDVKGEWNKLVH